MSLLTRPIKVPEQIRHPSLPCLPEARSVRLDAAGTMAKIGRDAAQARDLDDFLETFGGRVSTKNGT